MFLSLRRILVVKPKARSGKHFGIARQRWPPHGPRSSLKELCSRIYMGHRGAIQLGKPDGLISGGELYQKARISKQLSKSVLTPGGRGKGGGKGGWMGCEDSAKFLRLCRILVVTPQARPGKHFGIAR